MTESKVSQLMTQFFVDCNELEHLFNLRSAISLFQLQENIILIVFSFYVNQVKMIITNLKPSCCY